MNKEEMFEDLKVKDEDLLLLGERIVSIIEETYSNKLEMVDFKPLKNFLTEVELIKSHEEKTILGLISNGVIDGMPTDLIYQMYHDEVTMKGNSKILTKTGFSRFIKKYYGYETRLVYYADIGKTKRAYFKIKDWKFEG